MPEKGRRYLSIGRDLRKKLEMGEYAVGERLPTERDIATKYNVSRTVIREAIIMLELEGLVEVRKGSGVYVMKLPATPTLIGGHQQSISGQGAGPMIDLNGDIGPFEMLQGRQLLESHIAGFAAQNITKAEISEMRRILAEERAQVLADNPSHDTDKQFHIAIARATKNGLLIEVMEAIWSRRESSKMWAQLHADVDSQKYRMMWVEEHAAILNALLRKNPEEAKLAMWKHLDSVKQTLMKFSDIDDDSFDGFLFDSYQLEVNS
ncbi:FCD domain-containing protein [Vibrio sp. 10N.286.52.C3]|uniref:FCD domain-containing protein n=1 Tax=unclassified Vibrio TaxID=2614977 RepID=UPI0035545BB9